MKTRHHFANSGPQYSYVSGAQTLRTVVPNMDTRTRGHFQFNCLIFIQELTENTTPVDDCALLAEIKETHHFNDNLVY